MVWTICNGIEYVKEAQYEKLRLEQQPRQLEWKDKKERDKLTIERLLRSLAIKIRRMELGCRRRSVRVI